MMATWGFVGPEGERCLDTVDEKPGLAAFSVFKIPELADWRSVISNVPCESSEFVS